ncbi:MAG: Fe(3+) ABC transporter substrate-binding protein [Moraxellaceae bacterium]|nr:Fe(3+) ABC transporter substrate-binding protein [Moraxellaceae bacterium]
MQNRMTPRLAVLSRALATLPLLATVLAPAANANPTAAEVNVYSARQEALIRPVLDDFTAKTGIKVNLVSAKADALLQRLKSEGRNTPADVLLTVDAGNLGAAKDAGLLHALKSDLVKKAVPAHYRDNDGLWTGLSLRARPVFYARDRVKPEQLSTYAALTGQPWKGKICVRSSDNIYNQSMVAAMISNEGEKKTEAWVKGLVGNFARPPKGGDRDQIKAVAAGQCDLAIANTYYYAEMLKSDDAAERAAAEKVGVFWPDQQGRGVHVNISGAGIVAHAKNAANARRLIEFLAGPEAQAWYADNNQEYPVRADVPVSDTLKSLGDYKADKVSMSKLGANNARAVKLMDRAGWR